jgi:hypothetical protein
MNDFVNVIGIKHDGSSKILGTAPLPARMKREDLAKEQFGQLSRDGYGNDADCCLWALEIYHEWLVQQGWMTPLLVIAAPTAEGVTT